MPAGRLDQTLYRGPFGNEIENINTATLYRPGELGSQIQTVSNKSYQLVQVDSGATASTGAGLPLSGHVAFWKDRSKYLVTNDKAQAEGANASAAAGVFCSISGGASGTASITPAYYGVIQQRGTHSGVLTNGTAAAAGDVLAATVTATSATAAVSKFTPGTAPTSTVVGVATAATSAVTANYTPCRVGGADLVDVG